MIELSKLKEFLGHEEYAVRAAVVDYLEEAGLTDLSVTELILRRCEDMQDSQKLLYFLHKLTNFEHSRETLSRLYKIERGNSSLNLSEVFERTAIAELEAFVSENEVDGKYLDILENRKSFAQTPTSDLWEKLWAHSESGMDSSYNEFDDDLGYLMIYELAKRKDFPHDKFLDKIGIIYDEDYCGWDDIFLCCLAGELKSEDSVDFLLRSLEIDADLLNEKAGEALGKIRTVSVVDKIKSRFIDNEFYFKIYANSVLEHIKTDECEAAVLELLAVEKNVSYKTGLADVLCRMFSEKGMPACITMLQKGYDDFVTTLEKGVYVTHIMRNMSHPDMDKWKKVIHEADERLFEAVRDMTADSNFELDENDMLSALEKISDRKKNLNEIQKVYDSKPKVGRNEPCPCGSGQKYKRCCGKNI